MDFFRHSFAVNALLRWYREGADVQSKLPLLATYMGHVSIVSTEYYLHFIDELAAVSSARFA
ncbi:MAG: integrase, partial [Thermodesulfobacteriota bacterium]